ncbi:hypothetical protein [Desulfocurvibacter africanus]|nr:hypothetical protein [Desulfocurvibacter africanus]
MSSSISSAAYRRKPVCPARLAAVMLVSLLLLTGCGLSTTSQLGNFSSLYARGLYLEAEKAAMDSKQELSEIEGGDGLLLCLNAASAALAAGEYRRAVDLLDRAEALSGDADLEGALSKTGGAAAEILVNRNVLGYEPRQYDRIFMNSYKALAFLAMGDADNARVELNRAFDRQRRAVEFFEAEIAKARDAGARRQAGSSSNSSLDTQRIAQASRAQAERMADEEHWKPYPDYVNPFATYLNGLFFLLAGQDSGDLDKALNSLRRVRGMVGDNPYLEQDIALAEAWIDGSGNRRTTEPTVWVIFENGLAPDLAQARFNLPLFVVNARMPVKYFAVAFPALQPGRPALSNLGLASGGVPIAETAPLADVGRVVGAEYKVRLPYELTMAALSAASKAMLQYGAQQAGGGKGTAAGQAASAIMALYTAVTTTADTRSWTSLPTDAQLARLSRPADGRLAITTTEGRVLRTLTLPEARFCLIHVRMPTAGAEPACAIIPFQEVLN